MEKEVIARRVERRNVATFGFVILLIVVLAGCASKIRMYSGNPRPRDEVATVGIEGWKCTESDGICELVMITYFDSVSIMWVGTDLLEKMKKGRPLEILPGEHFVTVQWYRGRRYWERPQHVEVSRQMTLEFTAEGGHDYLVTGDILENGKKFAAHILDKVTGEPIRFVRVDSRE